MDNIDKRIAKEVMGWTVVRREYHDDGTSALWWADKMDNNKHFNNSFEPSTNITHALEVEAEMFRRGIRILIGRKEDGTFHVQFRGNGIVADTLPETICLAALKAMEE